MSAVTSLITFLSAVLWTGCVQIDGGAVELSWAIRNFGGDSLECAQARVETVRLCWRNAGESGELTCPADNSVEFVCDREQGASAFEVPPGDQALWIEVDCVDSERAEGNSYEVPAPIVRTVTDGNIVTLNSLLIVVATPPNPDMPSNCGTRPCTCPP